MKAAVLVFPGINRERDMARTLRLVSGQQPAMVWHAEPELPADMKIAAEKTVAFLTKNLSLD